MLLRPANVKDARVIYDLITEFSNKGLLLQRSLSNIYDNIRDFQLVEFQGEIAGIGSLHVCWEDIAEIRSLCVRDKFAKRGIGSKLTEYFIEDAKRLGVKRIFVLTYQVKFFERFDFFVVNKKVLPPKVWSECINCPKFPDCDEIAMLKILKNGG